MTHFLPCPKPRARVLDRIDYKRKREREEQAFRNTVWKRDQSVCRGCGRHLKRAAVDMLLRGEIHHRHGRNVRPDDRCNPDAAVLLCRKCHFDPTVVQRFRAEAP